MNIPTEPIGSIPRPAFLQKGMADLTAGKISPEELADLEDKALIDTIRRFEETGSPVITDGEQGKPSFLTYPLSGAALAPDGIVIPFADGHTRRLPRLTAGPFSYQVHADEYLRKARIHATKPVKQAVIAASALSLIYPENGLDGYSQAEFLADLVDEAEADIRRSLEAGAACVQIDFTEARLALKMDPSGGLLRSFIDLNNSVLERFSDDEAAKIGVHSCPGGDQDSPHSLDVGYGELIPMLFELRAGNFYLQMASETDPRKVLKTVQQHARPEQRIFIGVIDPIDPRVETAEEVRDRVLEAAEFISPARLGTCDDCGFSPFADDLSTSRDLAFAKIAARVEGTRLAAEAVS
ncbi:cobalamin-independent methionine synthase II family protein [Amycolatopsis saalfeldensis]|uniref:5-methyltetrahydropteroyltriglutamate--homocysteine methyltransferase n=1 Tax=Amycolatopsis saalfeldensis TaxID=394193 RepID=A0A1H8YLU1_9PSEU|nr:cobalamin-independent methionine synthase II family protein [Amycolatopsis saalfeldensis]SEP52368.1 5-methyltetrahydropteroyltriglutamate--homocysteine methyltransferase [Amycolatopsis saalfeldensis]